MVSKGIDCFTYLSSSQFKTVLELRGIPDINFNFLPHDQNTELGKIQMTHCELKKSSLKGPGGILENTGTLRIKAFQKNSMRLSKYAEINPVTGNIGDSNMKKMLDTTSEIGENYAVSYGFCDTGLGKSHQVYAYITDNYSNWMSDLINAIPQLKEKPFGTFVLPGSHDAGMFTGITSKKIFDILRNCNFSPLVRLVEAAGELEINRIMINLAYTQKDNINTQLKLGIRYFDFRPGYTIDRRIDSELRHQHYCVPGYRFDSFLSDVVGFLKEHKNEVVVVNIKYDGFSQEEMKPSDDTVAQYISHALVNSNIQKGDIEDIERPIKDLLSENKRLIILKGASNCRDSYSDKYKTDDVNKIIESVQLTFDKTEESWTVLQLQSTFTGTLEGGKDAVITSSDASSPLLLTKAKFDYATYNWIGKKENVASKCGKNLLVLLNDFVDNALVSHAIAITKQRLDSV